MKIKEILIKGDFNVSLWEYCKTLNISNQYLDDNKLEEFRKFNKLRTVSKAEIVYYTSKELFQNQSDHLSIEKDLLVRISNSLPDITSEFGLKIYLKHESVEVPTTFELGTIISSSSNCGLLIYERLYELLNLLDKISSNLRKQFLKDYFQFILQVLDKNLLFIHTSNNKDLRILFDNIPKKNVIGYETPFANKISNNKQQHYCINLNL